MAQIAKKWIEDDAVDNRVLDNDVQFTVGGLISNAPVGIGSSNPQGLLHVYGGSTYFYGSDSSVILAETDSSAYLIQLQNRTVATDWSRPFRVRQEDSGKIRIDNNGRDGVMNFDQVGHIGLGTTSPESAFHVFGDTTTEQIALSQSGGNMVFLESASADGAVGTTSNMPLRIVTGSSTQMTVLTNGDVGIGTTDPQAKLHVTGNIFPSSDGSGWLGGSGNRWDQLYMAADAEVDCNGALIFEIGPQERIRFSALGLVGIGTADPQALLHVMGDIVPSSAGTGNLGSSTRRWDNLYMDSTVDYSNDLLFNSSGEKIRFTTAGSIGIGTSDPYTKFHVRESDSSATSLNACIASFEKNDHAWLEFLSPNDKRSGIIFSDPEDAGIGSIEYFHNHDDLVFFVNNAERVRFHSSGNVGIGTDNPQAKLHVMGDIVPSSDGSGNLGSSTRRWDNLYVGSTVDYSSDLTFNSSGEKVRFQTDGDVGIGVTNPITGLHVKGPYSKGYLTVESTLGDPSIFLSDSTTNKVHLKYVRSSDYVSLAHGYASSSQLVLKGSGNVGMGTTDPGAKVDIDQANDAGAIPVIELTQADEDESFISLNGFGTSDVSKNITSLGINQDSSAGVVAAPDHADWDCMALFKIEIGGVSYWIPAYQPN